MFAKPLSLLTYDDILDLVQVRQEREGHHLDYKREIGNPEKAKRELAKDVCAFANSGGGFLVIGVDDAGSITGIESKLGNKGVDEWLNQVLAANINPPVYYEDPKLIPIQGSSKFVLVLRVPESPTKPHMLTEGNNYPVRMNDSAQSAAHSQVREMFDSSRSRTMALTEFMAKRNLLDPEDPSFCRNQNSKRLTSDAPEDRSGVEPFVLFSLIPRDMLVRRSRPSYDSLKQWLGQHRSGHLPAPSQSLFYSMHEAEPRLDGILLKHTSRDRLKSYLEVLDNGYVEAGLCNGVIHWSKDERNGEPWKPSIFLTSIIGYEMMLLAFARDFYREVQQDDEILLQLSFANMAGAELHGLHRERQLRPPYPRNTQHANFKISDWVSPMKLNEVGVHSVAKQHSELICRAFGIEQESAFVEGELDHRELNHPMV